ncbi:general secretion pathway protein GspD [Synechococcus sp. BS55D]|nr:secretin N-terminal domain-containing protein [Synechococcus sp. BS55D]TCD58350.1 general secretion pathway protein GspD [Synechococcus sp. BS55D]
MAAPVAVQAEGGMQLQARRAADGLEIVVVGVGARPVLQQRLVGGQWQGRLTTKGAPGVRAGFGQLALPELGIRKFSLEGDGSTYLLRFEAVNGVAPAEPVVSADGRNLILSFPGLASPSVQTGRLDLNTPGRVPQARYAPPLQPRAVAPPLGDMAVGTMVLQNRSFVNVSGPPVTLTLNNAPAKDALMSLARLGGYGFVYVGDGGGATTAPGQAPGGAVASGGSPVSMSFQNESYARALNGVLLASGLQGKLDGRTLLVGTAVSAKTFGPQVSKVYRLNQASASSAADYLASLGASVSKVNTTSITSGDPSSLGTSQLSNQISQTTSTLTSVETYGAAVGPLRGLTGTTDARLQTVTLVGDSQLVAIAESYLKQIDLRQRQVALTIRILDINLENDKQIANSFAFRSGNMFVVSDNGELLANFGSYKPPATEAGGLPGRYAAQDGTTPVPGTGVLAGENSPFFDKPSSAYPLPGSRSQLGGSTLSPVRPDFGTYDNPLQPGVSDVTEDRVEYTAPTKFQYPEDQFFDFLRARIQSTSTKVLASPTLVLQEGGEKSTGTDKGKISEDGKIGRELSNEAYVRVGTQFVTSFEVKQDVNGNNFCQPVFANAGLTFGARVEKIDDNGFVTFALSPEISAPVGTEQVGNCGSITIINDRSLDTGKIRVRDGQTLILTGVISDTDRAVVTKWPILGDLPFIGQFFRNSGGERSKSELVILVTPRIIDDREGGTYGYGYKPSLPAARQVLSGT